MDNKDVQILTGLQSSGVSPFEKTALNVNADKGIQDLVVDPRKKFEIINGVEYSSIIRDVPGKIDGGFFGYGSAFVIEFDKSPLLKGLFEEIEAEVGNEPSEEIVLGVVYKKTCELFTNSNEKEVDALGYRIRNKIGIVSLENFAQAKTGFCTQASAFEALMIEKLIEKGRIKGNVSISGFDVETPEYSGGHVFCRFESRTKKWVLDAMAPFMGSEEDYEPVKKDIVWKIERDFGSI